jgi:hypothetical protein
VTTRRSIAAVSILATAGVASFLLLHHREHPATTVTKENADSTACAQCHASEAAGYADTGMAHAFYKPTAPNLQNPAASLAASSASSPYSPAISFNDQDHMPLVQQWNIGFERQLPLALTLEVNYVGNHATHLSYNLNENQVPLASVPAVTSPTPASPLKTR